MRRQIEYSVSMTPDEVLESLRANTPNAAEVLESLERQPVFCRKQPTIVSRIDGHNFRLHFQGGRLGGRLSDEHVEGTVEATPTGSKVIVELKNFDPIWRFPACIGLGCIVVAIVLGIMLLDDLPVGAILIFLACTGYGIFSFIWPRRLANSQKQRFVDFLSKRFDQ